MWFYLPPTALFSSYVQNYSFTNLLCFSLNGNWIEALINFLKIFRFFSWMFFFWVINEMIVILYMHVLCIKVNQCFRYKEYIFHFYVIIFVETNTLAYCSWAKQKKSASRKHRLSFEYSKSFYKACLFGVWCTASTALLLDMHMNICNIIIASSKAYKIENMDHKV